MEYEIWENTWKELVEKWSTVGYESLSEDERIWLNMRSLIDSVDNGGIMSYFYDSNADYLEETLEDLKKIGCSEVIELLNRVCELFPEGKPSKDGDERNQVIQSWDEEGLDYSAVYEEVDDGFYDLEDELEARLEPIIQRILEINK